MPGVAERTHIDWEEAYERFSPQLRQVEDFLQSFEKEYGVELTPGAYEMIVVPLVEVLQTGEELNLEMVRNTLEQIVIEVAKEPAARDVTLSKKNSQQTRSSWSVIKAFWKRWCNIPPLCDSTGE